MIPKEDLLKLILKCNVEEYLGDFTLKITILLFASANMQVFGHDSNNICTALRLSLGSTDFLIIFITQSWT